MNPLHTVLLWSVSWRFHSTDALIHFRLLSWQSPLNRLMRDRNTDINRFMRRRLQPLLGRQLPELYIQKVYVGPYLLVHVPVIIFIWYLSKSCPSALFAHGASPLFSLWTWRFWLTSDFKPRLGQWGSFTHGQCTKYFSASGWWDSVLVLQFLGQTVASLTGIGIMTLWPYDHTASFHPVEQSRPCILMRQMWYYNRSPHLLRQDPKRYT